MYLFPLLEVVGNLLHISEYILPSLVMLVSTVVKNTIFVLLLVSRAISGGFSLVGCSSFFYNVQVFHFSVPHFSICLLISFSVRPGHVPRKPCLINLMRLAVVGMNSAAYIYCASSGFDVYTIILFITAGGC